MGETLAESDLAGIRGDFPILQQRVHGKPLVYLDNAATTQKPQCVIDAVSRYYGEDNANVHRGLHALSERATEAYEGARARIRAFLGAPLVCEIVFTRGATEGINLVAQSYARPRLGPGDEILVTVMEHHSNIVPWQIACEQTGARLRVCPMHENGELMLDAFGELLGPKTKLAAVTHVSNALGTLNPVDRLVELAHAAGVPILVDGAQSAAHLPVNVDEMGCDFFVCSGHKMYAPTGIGVLYGKAALLQEMAPYQAGGEMIRSVTFEGTTYAGLPHRFEAGTPNIGGVIGLGAAIDYLTGIGLARVARYEEGLLTLGTELLEGIAGLRIIGTAPHKSGVLSFYMDDVHPHDIGQLLDDAGVAVRVGHHCAQPVMDYFDIPATARASLALYNTEADLRALAESMEHIRGFFGV